jgi:murein DD-endopeptidase MepM/ murein hydrolase activator NlpD
MSLNFKKNTRTTLTLCALGMTLTACDGDFTLGKLGDKIDRPPSAVAANTDERPPADANGIITYPHYQVAIARKGDTVASVADRVGISADRLARHNGLNANANLRKGEIIALPKGFRSLTAGPAKPSSIEDIASTALDSAPSAAPSVQTGAEPVRHTVRSGETAYTVARLYNVSVTALASWNGLGPDLSVRNGQRLLIPTTSEEVEPLPTTNPGTGTPSPIPASATKALPKPVAAKPVAAKPAVKEPAVSKPAEPAVAKPAAKASSKMIKPVSGNVLRGFSKKSGGNEGIDYAAPTGANVKAAATGTVALISKSVGDTTIVLLRHPNNLYTVYSNITNVALKKGQSVSAGSTVGIVAGGSPSFVHFEIRKGTEAVDPAPYL